MEFFGEAKTLYLPIIGLVAPGVILVFDMRKDTFSKLQLNPKRDKHLMQTIYSAFESGRLEDFILEGHPDKMRMDGERFILIQKEFMNVEEKEALARASLRIE